MDKAANMAKEIKSTANVVVGAVTGDDVLKAEGRADKAKGNLQQAGENVKTQSRGEPDQTGRDDEKGPMTWD